MATHAPDVLHWLADRWEGAIDSAVCSGIVGDSAHRDNPSKHNSYSDNKSHNGNSWATSHSKDQTGPRDMACALDMSMSDKDMELVHGRFKALYNARGSDDRAQYVDCFNGWDGSGSPGRYDLPAGTVSGTDDSHKWHEHVETFYCYVGEDELSWEGAHAILSVVRGETEAQWLENSSGEEDDMTPEEHDALMLIKRWTQNTDKYAWFNAIMADPVTGIRGNQNQEVTVENLLARKILELDKKLDTVLERLNDAAQA
jgi:hypothetical protein